MSEITSYPQHSWPRCRSNMAHARQSRPDSGLDFQVKVLEPFSVVPSSLGSGLGVLCGEPPTPKPQLTFAPCIFCTSSLNSNLMNVIKYQLRPVRARQRTGIPYRHPETVLDYHWPLSRCMAAPSKLIPFKAQSYENRFDLSWSN